CSLSTSLVYPSLFLFFFFNATATTEIYTLSLHDALPIYRDFVQDQGFATIQAIPLSALEGDNILQAGTRMPWYAGPTLLQYLDADRKSTRLNSSHVKISYAVFCLKKKKTNNKIHQRKNTE